MHMFFTLQRRLEGYRTFRIKIRLHRTTSWVCQVKKRAISDVHTKKVLHLELWIQHNSRLSWYGLKSCLLLLMLFFSFDSVAGTSSDILCGPQYQAESLESIPHIIVRYIISSCKIWISTLNCSKADTKRYCSSYEAVTLPSNGKHKQYVAWQTHSQ